MCPYSDINNHVLFLTSYPPRGCGIATYSKDLVTAIHEKFNSGFTIKIAALEDGNETYKYLPEVEYILNTSNKKHYFDLAYKINTNKNITKVFIQHEFGLFGGKYGEDLLILLYSLDKPVSITFHSVIPQPNSARKNVMLAITQITKEIVVMTHQSADILIRDYNIPKSKLSVIPHGIHILPSKNKKPLKMNYGLQDKMVLTTFGLLGPNKNIETAISALPEIVKHFPNVVYLVLGKTHPGIIKKEGEVYRDQLKTLVVKLGMEQHVQFVNKYLSLPQLLEYLALTDIYLFTSNDPNQAVSGTFAYAMSSFCAIISTPIPHAIELLRNNMGIIVDFEDSKGFANAAINLLRNKEIRKEMSRNAFQQIQSSAWQNSSIAHALLFNRHFRENKNLIFNHSDINLNHIKDLTTTKGIIQFSDLCQPDINSGYTLDDNARALIALCYHYDQTMNIADLNLMNIYLDFIHFCQQDDGSFLNYLDFDETFNMKNGLVNLEDSNGRAIWALGTIISYHSILPMEWRDKATKMLNKALPIIETFESPRAMAFSIKGLYHYHKRTQNIRAKKLIALFAERLVSKYKTVSEKNWKWFEEYLTYANSILPEALLIAYLSTGTMEYRTIAQTTFRFLLTHLFVDESIRVVSNNGWFHKNKKAKRYGEQPIDVAYTIQALESFYSVFQEEEFSRKMEIAFSWFEGNNHLNQIIYNPANGGCYDGLEEKNVNLNQGAESTICYLISRLIVERMKNQNLESVGYGNREIFHPQKQPIERNSSLATGKVNI